jgi:hypothetical protein
MTDQPDLPLAGLSIDTSVHLRWVCAISKASEPNFMGISPDDLITLTKMGLIEMRDEVPALTNEDESALDWS